MSGGNDSAGGPEARGIDLGCPNCGETTGLKTIESIEGYAAVMFRKVADGVDEDPEGSTDVNWDTAVSVGVCCGECMWEYRGQDYEQKLIVPGPDREAPWVPARVFAEALAAWTNALNRPISTEERAGLAESDWFLAAVAKAYDQGRAA